MKTVTLDPYEIYKLNPFDYTTEQTQVIEEFIRINGHPPTRKNTNTVDLLNGRRCRYLLNEQIPEPFMQRGDDLLLREGATICAIGGGQKSAKTDITTHIFAQAISGNIQSFVNRTAFTLQPNTQQKAVLYFDGEQPKENSVEKIYKRAVKRSGRNEMPDHCEVYHLRGMKVQDRKDAISQECENMATKHGGIYCIFIDPLTKLMRDAATDGVESQSLADWLEALTAKYNCPVFVVVHLNARDTQGNVMRGHIGAEMHRLADCIIICRKVDQNTVGVELVEARNAPGNTIDQYSWDEKRGGFSYSGTGSKNKTSDIDAVWQRLQHLVGTNVSWAEIIIEIQEAANCAQRKAGSILNTLCDMGRAVKTNKSYAVRAVE